MTLWQKLKRLRITSRQRTKQINRICDALEADLQDFVRRQNEESKCSN